MKSMPAQSLLCPVPIGLEAHLEAMEQILFLVTFRGNEIQPSLEHYLSQLERERRSREIRLAPLSRADTSLMVQTTFAQNRPTHIEFIDKLYHLTEGNPFYIEVTLKATYDPDNLFRFSFNVVPAVATQTEM